MQVEIRLKKLLRQRGLDGHGITQRIAQDLRVHRHTIGKLYRNQLRYPSLEVLGAVSGWLANHGVPSEILPHALLGARPSELWQAVSEPGAVTLFVGESRQADAPGRPWRWIAQQDAVAMANIVQFLSSPRDFAERRLEIGIEYVPFRFVSGEREVNEEQLDEDKKRARKIFDNMRAAGCQRNAVLIGSQRINHLVELLVADIFGCEAFRPLKPRSKIVPFYLAYRQHDRVVSSCFGGPKPPPGRRSAGAPGIYFLNKDEEWEVCPWEQDKRDAGIVIVVRDPGTAALEMAMFGFSGRGTEALGARFLHDPDAFWSPVRVGAKEVAVSVCRFNLERAASEKGEGELHTKDVEVIRLDTGVLRKHVV